VFIDYYIAAKGKEEANKMIAKSDFTEGNCGKRCL